MRGAPDLTLEAPAKINLCLRALGRRPDGYTEIVTLFQTVSLSDTLEFRRSPEGVKVTCADPLVPPGEGNLAHRAAALFLARTGARGGVEIAVTKRIPVAAGLGGGSSDAAAALAGCNALWGSPLDGRRLHALAAELGSDVPFLLQGGAAIGRGRGEVLEQLPDLPRRPLVLVYPGIGVRTAEAYRLLPPALTGEVPDISILLRSLAGGAPGMGRLLVNDLQAGVAAANPPVREALARLRETGAEAVLMSGSGSACYGLYRDGREARGAARSLAGVPRWKIFTAFFSPARVQC